MKKTAFIAIVGRPNVGKSTLLNSILGEKVAIVSKKPQTTRNRITGIHTVGENQFVFLDTPGIHKPRTKLGDYMVKTTAQTIAGVDTAILVVEAREAVGDIIGANVDPSHLIWQGMDPVAAIRELKGAIYHVHAKDTKIDTYNTAKNGVLDTKHYGRELERSWVFRTVGYGNDEIYWRDLVSNLRLCGYDKVLSIEHEDSVMSIDEGLRKAISFLKDIIIEEEKPTTMSWA